MSISLRRYIISYGGDFQNVGGNWQWNGTGTTSLMLADDVGYDCICAAIREKASLKDYHKGFSLKFLHPELALPHVEILDDDDLSWYQTITSFVPLCVISTIPENSVRRNEHMQPTHGIGVNPTSNYNRRGNSDVVHHRLELNRFARNQRVEDMDVHRFMNDRHEFDIMVSNVLDNDWGNTDVIEFRVIRTSTTCYHVACIDLECKWFVRSSRVGRSEIFKVRRLQLEHTCGVDFRRDKHRNATVKFIGKYIRERVRDNHSYAPSMIIADIRRELGIGLSYWKAWRAREYAQRLDRGPDRASYGELPKYCYMLEASNPGTVTRIETDEYNRFKYLFIAFGSSIYGFSSYIRRVICIDGTHLKATYRGVLLMATCQDGNNNIFPLAWGIVGSETKKSWEWFLSCLCECVDNNSELVFVSDRMNGIGPALSRVFPNAHHGTCCWHIANNIRNRFHRQSYYGPFIKTAYAYCVSHFDRGMEEILALSKAVHGYLVNAGIQHWSRAHFPGLRYNVMTSNTAESVNSLLRHERQLPILSLLQEIRSIMQRWHYERFQRASNCSTILTPYMQSRLLKTFDAGTTLRAVAISQFQCEVGTGRQANIVDLHHKTCTCRRFDLDQIPCKHATRGGCHLLMNLYDLCSPYFTTEYWKRAYERQIFPTNCEDDIVIPPKIANRVVLPPIVRRPVGRPPNRRHRYRSEIERAVRRCGRCRSTGHHRQTCTAAINSIPT